MEPFLFPVPPDHDVVSTSREVFGMKGLGDVAKEVNDKFESLGGLVDVTRRMDQLVGVIGTVEDNKADEQLLFELLARGKIRTWPSPHIRPGHNNPYSDPSRSGTGDHLVRR